ncbi:MAG: hypothetical protein PVSMB7_17240 [Chloroflexota bacterium]
MIALPLVYRNLWNVVLGLIAFVAMAGFYLWSSQVLIIGRHGVTVVMQAQFVAAALIMALLFGLLVPVLVYAARLAAASATQTGGTVFGAVLGTMSMTCCAPILLPALLSLLGFSGTTILGLNETLNRFWLPLATISIILLSYSLVSVVRSLELVCAVNPAARVTPPDRGFREAVGEKRVSVHSK